MSINYTPRTWVAGEVVTAAYMNTEVRDALTGIQAVWTAFTPTWTAATSNPTLGNGSWTGSRWNRQGKTGDFRIVLTMGSTTAYGSGQWRMALPVNLIAEGRMMDTMTIVDSGTGFLRGEVQYNTSGNYLELFSDSTVAAGYERAVGTGVPIGYATSDQLTIKLSSVEIA